MIAEIARGNIPNAAARRRRLATLAAALALATLAGCAKPAPLHLPITIVTALGPFAGVGEAADGEARVDWGDGDATDDDACTEAYAAVELRRHLSRALAIEERAIVLSGASRLPARGDVIVLGSRRSNPLVATAWPGAAPAGDVGDAFAVRGGRRAGRSVFVVEGAGRTGTLYGTYRFLETLGVRFDDVGDSAATYPIAPATLPSRLAVAESPVFVSRGFWSWEARGNRDFFVWMARNRMNLWSAAEHEPAFLKKLGIRLSAGGHDVQARYLAPAEYFRSHPEWFGLHGKKRSPAIHDEAGDNFCTSDTAAIHQLATNLVRDLDGGRLRFADVVNLWPLDQGRWCECDRCRAIGNPADRMIAWVARMQLELADARRAGLLKRSVDLAWPAYLETLAPPTQPLPAGFDTTHAWATFFPYFRCYAHALSDPSCTEINARIAAAYRAWSSRPERLYHGPVEIGEYYNVGAFKSLPLLFPHVMAADLADYAKTGARRFHYMHAPTRLLGSWALDHAVLSRLLWDPAANVDSVMTDFRQHRYPSTFGTMAVFHTALEHASSNILAIEQCVGAFGYTGAPAGRLTAADVVPFPLRHLQAETRSSGADSAPSWNEIVQAMAEARAAIDDALGAAHDARERARIADEERRFAYGEATFGLYDRLLRVVIADRAGDRPAARRALAAADSVADRLRGMRDVVQVAASHANARDGLDASHVEATLAFFRRRFRR